MAIANALLRLNALTALGDNIVGIDQLRERVEQPEPIVLYDGFEPSNRLHMAQGLTRASKINNTADLNIKWKLWIADIFAILNSKREGNEEEIHVFGQFFIECWRALIKNPQDVEFIWASEHIAKNTMRYLGNVLKVATTATISDMKSCSSACGKVIDDDAKAALPLYINMQMADVFDLGLPIPQMGKDQEPLNIMVRQIAEKNGIEPPIIISHNLLPSLSGSPKMSKSDPDSAIWLDEEESEVMRKCSKAKCDRSDPETPTVKWLQVVLFPWENQVVIHKADGEKVVIKDVQEMKRRILALEWTEDELRTSLGRGLAAISNRVIQHFKNDPNAAAIKAKVDGFVAAAEARRQA